MKHRILIRPAARRDLDDQAIYLSQDRNVETALRFYRDAEDTLQLLASHPKIGSSVRWRSRFLAGVRMFPLQKFSRHLVFYRPLDHGIEILRIVHGARDLESLFPD